MGNPDSRGCVPLVGAHVREPQIDDARDALTRAGGNDVLVGSWPE